MRSIPNDETPNPVRFTLNELFLLFDALDHLLQCPDRSVHAWLTEGVGPATFRHRVEALHAQIADHIS